MDIKDINPETPEAMDADIKANVSYPQGLRLARAYVPVQVFIRKFEPFEGLMRGTIFPELYRPYRERKIE